MKWNEQYGQSQEILDWIALHLLGRCSAIPAKAELVQLISSGKYLEVIKYKVPPFSEMNVADAMFMRQAIALYKKNPSIPLGINTKDVAIASWLSCEADGKRLNAQFSSITGVPPAQRPYVEAAARKIRWLLGDEPPRISELGVILTSGSNSSVNKSEACPRTKFSAVPQCTPNAIRAATEFLYAIPRLSGLWEDSGSTSLKWGGERAPNAIDVISTVTLELVDEELLTVRKTALTDRTIGRNPLLNLMLQRGYGNEMEKRLKRVGIDLTNQQGNKHAAQIGSLTGALATLDLSEASDRVWRMVVKLLFPRAWYLALLECAPTHIMVGKKRHELQKMGSSGNGFIFSLQTILYWALCCSIVPTVEQHQVLVYGDDIVVPSSSALAVMDLIESLGMKVNRDKSYFEGPFRESCGGDYYCGINIRPWFATAAVSSKSLTEFHNFLWRLGDYETASLVESLVDPEHRLYGPDNAGDGHLIGQDSPMTPYKRHDGWGGYAYRTWSKSTRHHNIPLRAEYLLPAWYSSQYPDRPDNGLWALMGLGLSKTHAQLKELRARAGYTGVEMVGFDFVRLPPSGSDKTTDEGEWKRSYPVGGAQDPDVESDNWTIRRRYTF